jgi:hypothetical protein
VQATASDELNVTLLSWNACTGPPEHVNEDRDALVVVLDGSATVRIDDEEYELAPGETTIVAKGRKRRITAGRDGVRYLSVHRHRPPLQIARAASEQGGIAQGTADELVAARGRLSANPVRRSATVTDSAREDACRHGANAAAARAG